MGNNMVNGDIKILDKLSINQNIIGLIISYIGVVYIVQLDVYNSYWYCLVSFIGCLCLVLFFVCTLSVISSMIVYAIEYWKKKWYKGEGHKVEYENKKSDKTSVDCKTSVNCKRCTRCPCKDCEL